MSDGAGGAELVNRQDQLREKFQEWLHEKGSALVGDVEKESGLIDSLLRLRAQMNTILAEPFCKEDVFAKVPFPHLSAVVKSFSCVTV